MNCLDAKRRKPCFSSWLVGIHDDVSAFNRSLLGDYRRTYLSYIVPSTFKTKKLSRYTLESESKVPFPRQLHHPISLASFNLKGWNLVCGTPWPNPALTQNFSPNGLVVLEIWQNMWFFPHFEKEGKMERREKWQLWQKWQPAAQATGTSEMENNKKGWLQWKITILIKVYEKV